MSSIARRLIDLSLIACVSLATVNVSCAEDTVTPLQLRVMQTRKFLKPAGEVAKAIKENGADAGGTCGVIAPKFINGAQIEGTGSGTCSFPHVPTVKNRTNAANFVPIVGLFKSSSDISKMKADMDAASTAIAKAAYEISADPDSTETVVRMRLYRKYGTEQITDSAAYSEAFNKLADSLFIQAIEITPAVQE